MSDEIKEQVDGLNYVTDCDRCGIELYEEDVAYKISNEDTEELVCKQCGIEHFDHHHRYYI